jgi:hypothetical protein
METVTGSVTLKKIKIEIHKTDTLPVVLHGCKTQSIFKKVSKVR